MMTYTMRNEVYWNRWRRVIEGRRGFALVTCVDRVGAPVGLICTTNGTESTEGNTCDAARERWRVIKYAQPYANINMYAPCPC